MDKEDVPVEQMTKLVIDLLRTVYCTGVAYEKSLNCL